MDKKFTQKLETVASPIEGMPVTKTLLRELTSLERSATPEVIEKTIRYSNRISSPRIRAAREYCGSAVDSVFFEQKKNGPVRSTANTQSFITRMFL